jgi:hypothetical protein
MGDPAERQPAFVAVYWPADHFKVAMVKMVLEREGVNFYIENELASMGVLPMNAALHPRVMVQADRADECKRLLEEELGVR